MTPILIFLFFQIPIDQLNRASRLLLGALLEAHDMLEQLHVSQGVASPVEHQTKENIERVRRLSTEISATEAKAMEQVAVEEEMARQEVQQEEVMTTTQDNLSNSATTSNNELPRTAQDGAPKASDPSPTRVRPTMPDLVPELTPTKPKNDLSSGLPDLLHAATLPTPRKRTPGRKFTIPSKSRRQVFRLSTLQEMAKSRGPQPITWAEAGSKLAEVAGSLRSPVVGPPNRSISGSLSPSQTRSGGGGGGEGKSKMILSGVVQIVSCVSLYLIVRKMESLLK